MAVDDVLLDRGGAVYNVRGSAAGVAGNGVADDGATFYALTAGRHYSVPAGTYRFARSGTIPAGVVLELQQGALLRPDSGVTITVSCPVRVGEHKWIDLSKGGVVSFAGNRSIFAYSPLWWGVVGDGVTDDQPALTAMIDAVQDYARIHVPGDMNIALGSTWTISNREGITITNGRDPRQGGTNGVGKLTWIGAAGGRMLFLDRCRYCTVDGFSWNSGSAQVAIDIDGYNPGIGTSCVISHNLFANAARSNSFVGVRISETATNNQEYHVLRNNNFNGYASSQNLSTVAMASASAVLTTTTPYFNRGHIGKRVRVSGAGAGAGAGGGPPGGVLDTTIASYQSPTQVTLAAVASRPVSGAYGVLDQSYGTAIKIGNSSNAKRIGIEDNNINGFQYGVHVQGGSYQLRWNSFNTNDIDVYVENTSEPCVDFGSNVETSRQHYDGNNEMPVTFIGCRWDIENVTPSGYFVWERHSAKHVVIGCSTENALPSANEHVFSLNGQGHTFTLMSNHFSPPMTMAQLGSADDGAAQTLLSNDGISDIPAASWLGGALFASGGGDQVAANHNGAIRGLGRSDGNSPNVKVLAGVVGEAQAEVGAAAGVVVCGVQALLGQNGMGGPAGAPFRGFDVVFPTLSSGGVSALEGLRIHSPSGMTGSSSAGGAEGVVVEPLARPQILGTPVAIDQQGTGDINKLAGRTYQAAPATAPSDAVLGASQISFYVDEAWDALKVRVKYADGVTVKTATIPLV